MLRGPAQTPTTLGIESEIKLWVSKPRPSSVPPTFSPWSKGGWRGCLYWLAES